VTGNIKVSKNRCPFVPDVLLKGHQSSATSQFLRENILTQLLFNVKTYA